MRTSLSCIHLVQTDQKHVFQCKLGYYGGVPLIGNCLTCIQSGSNTAEAKTAADQLFERSHPSARQRISGCCDRADQA